jgi:hypothetical protein
VNEIIQFNYPLMFTIISGIFENYIPNVLAPAILAMLALLGKGTEIGLTQASQVIL